MARWTVISLLEITYKNAFLGQRKVANNFVITALG